MSALSLLSTRDRAFDNSSLPALHEAWADNSRVGKPVIMTYGELGVTDLPPMATCVAYLDCHDHPAMGTTDPRHTFDNIDIDRLFSFATFREWTRHENDPRRGIIMTGPSGTGKSTFFEERFAQRGIPFYTDNAKPDMSASDLIQTKEVVNGTTYWEDGSMLKAAREGVPYCINEVDLFAPAQAAALNDMFEKGRVILPEDKSVFRAKRGFQVFATCNSSFTEDRTGSFRGTRGQNASVGNRFYKFTYPYATPAQETACILRVHPEIGEQLASRMANFAELTRKAADPMTRGLDGKRISQAVSRRHLLDWADMLKGMAYLKKNGEKIDLASYTLNFNYTAILAPEEQACIEHFLNLAFTSDNDPSGTTP